MDISLSSLLLTLLTLPIVLSYGTTPSGLGNSAQYYDDPEADQPDEADQPSPAANEYCAQRGTRQDGGATFGGFDMGFGKLSLLIAMCLFALNVYADQCMIIPPPTP